MIADHTESGLTCECLSDKCMLNTGYYWCDADGKCVCKSKLGSHTATPKHCKCKEEDCAERNNVLYCNDACTCTIS